MNNDDARLIRSSSVMGLGTIISRITGLVRNLLLVAVLGTGILGDAYNVANTTPNILYNLLIGGALSAVFVPQIVKSFRDADGGSAYVSRLVSLLASALLIITVLAMVIAPLFISIYAPTFTGRSRDVTIAFALYCLPQILFYGLFGVLGQVANAKERFGPMMWAPIANNLVVIALFTYFLSVTDEISLQTITDSQIRLLGIGTTLGIALQALILLPTIKSSGLRLRFRVDWRGVGLDKALKLASWMFVFVLISQLGFLATVNIATRAAVAADTAGVAYGVGYTPYSNAYLILILPHSIITVSVMTALLPKLANLVIDKKLNEVTNELTNAIKVVGVFIVPAAMIFLTFGPLIARNLYFGISADDADYVGYTLAGFAIGLIPVSINLILLRGLNAFENLKSQVFGNLIMNLISIVLSVLAAIYVEPKWVVVAMAIIFTVHYFIGTGISFYLISKHKVNLPIPAIVLHYLRLLAVFAFSIIPLFILRDSIPGNNLVQLIVVLFVSCFIYLLLGFLFKIKEIKSAIRILVKAIR